jgi:hypothetical protein
MRDGFVFRLAIRVEYGPHTLRRRPYLTVEAVPSFRRAPGSVQGREGESRPRRVRAPGRGHSRV